jgi:putative intracellular protease/amidase
MEITCLLFEGITALDAIGPYEVLSRVPGVQFTFVAPADKAVQTDNGVLGLVPGGCIDEVDHTDVLVVPGGFGTRRLMSDEVGLGWIRSLDATTTWTTSVCTGSLLLGAAGLLQGVPATTHWAEMETLADLGAHPVKQRVVESGKLVTSAGVSAGIDMALVLAARLEGDFVAQAIQLGIEYDPQPAFQAGSPDRAPSEVVEVIRSLVRATAAS